MIVHSLEEARAALAEARAEGRTTTLDSPAGAAGHQGIGWWLALIRILTAEFPDVEFDAVLDCADAPGLALAAIGAGVPVVRVGLLSPDMTGRLRSIAHQAGTRLLQIS